jgi:hypothetical protein
MSLLTNLIRNRLAVISVATGMGAEALDGASVDLAEGTLDQLLTELQTGVRRTHWTRPAWEIAPAGYHGTFSAAPRPGHGPLRGGRPGGADRVIGYLADAYRG